MLTIGVGPEEGHKDDQRGLEHLHYEDSLRAGAFQPRAEKTPGGPLLKPSST